MYSCVNYPRGCRGRSNLLGGKCSDCVVLNLRRPQSPFASPAIQTRDYRKSRPEGLQQLEDRDRKNDL